MKKKKKVSPKKRTTVRQTPPRDEDHVNITIDGHAVMVDKGKTVLDAAQALNIEIPTLCHHKALSPYGACRLCVVEIEQDGRKRVQSSCVYPARDGMVVRTGTDEIVNIRKTVIQLLLARAPGSRAVQDMARRLGVSDTPFVRRDEDCILCGLCVRMCRERMGRNVIGFKWRGDRREIAPPFDLESPQCVACGACFHVCPTASERLKKLGMRSPKPLLDEFDEGLRARSVIRIPFPQAVPNAAIIDREHCMHFLTDKCKVCEEFCEAHAIDFSQKEEAVDLNVGAVIVASGFKTCEGTLLREYGNGRFGNVVTSIEFERILSASGPYQGHIRRPGDMTDPHRIAFIQCVGSRDNEHPYCSSVCCMHATKEALIAREHSPGLECTIFYMDLRAFGKGFDEYYEKAKQSGIRYIRCRPSSIDEVSSTKNLQIKYNETDGSVREEEFDMVVLSCGLHPSDDNAEFARRADIALNEYGFCKAVPLDPVQSSREGVFVCGPCTEPKDIPETVTQSSAAAAKVMQVLASKRNSLVTTKEYPAEIDVVKDDPRIGVFVCHCGINIGAYVDVPQVVEHAKKCPGVVYAEANLYTCSQDSQRRIIDMIKQYNLNRIVVASCTPRTHEPLFRETLREAGLNPYLFEMANIRDQCSWIHMGEHQEATRKAKDLIAMAVAKTRTLTPLKRVEIDITQKAVVIGGGLAGMVTSLSIARQGYDVHLIEKQMRLGGHLREIYYTAEGDDVQEYLKRLVHDIESEPRISVHTGTHIESVNGFIGNYETTVVTAKGLKDTIKHGVVIVATGAKEYQPEEYLYKQDTHIVTQSEFEKMLAKGDRDDIEQLRSIVMIQCVGSRDNGRMYCSRRCCTQAIKNSMKFHALNPKAMIYVLYRDMRTYGFKEDRYTQARNAGVMFIQYDKDEKPRVVKENGHVRVSTFEPILQKTLEIKPDLVVLSTGIVPYTENESVAKMLKVPLNSDGYFLEAHVKLRPVDFATEGIFVAGLAHGPKFISETINQAEAAAARAATILANDTYYAEATVSRVDSERCVGCGVCSSLCPYNAIEIAIEDGSRKSRVTEALCKGCGTCVAACPSGAMDQYGFTKAQIMAMIEAVKE